MKKFWIRFSLPLLLIGVVAVGCATTPTPSLTPRQQAERLIVESKEVERYYRDIVRLYKAYYDAYKLNPTEENKRKLLKMAEIHDKAYRLYSRFRQIQVTLIEAGGDDEAMKGLVEKGFEILRQMTILAATSQGR